MNTTKSTPRLVLTETQESVLQRFVKKLDRNSPPGVFALSGSAGTGKSTLLARVPDYMNDVVFAAPTHAAVRVLRNKLRLAGYPDAVVKTYYAACLKPIYTKEFQHLIQNFNSANVEGVLEFFSNDRTRAREAMEEATNFDEFLFDMGVNRDNYLESWKASGNKAGRAIVIDEGSMLHINDLTEIQKAFTHIGLVGDPRQLYPVARDGDLNVSALKTYTQDDLTLKKILRTDNLDIIQAAKYAWKHGTYSPDIPVMEYTNEHARKYVPIICFMNRTRLSLNATIRESLGFNDQLSVNDCLVLRGKMKPFEVSRGLYNNSMWVVAKIDKDMAHLVSREDQSVKWQCPLDSISIEDLNSKPNRYNFRFAWALTCHTAQGSEWPTVFICPDRFVGPESDRWYYTATTRAQKNLFILK